MMADLHLQELHQLLAESVAAAQVREKAAFDTAAGSCHKSIVLFGAGNWGKRFAKCLDREGVKPLAFSDNNSAHWGKDIEGIPVLSPQEAARKYANQAAFVITISNGNHSLDQSLRQLAELGCTRVVPGMLMAWKFGDTLLPDFWNNLPSRILEHREEILSAYQAMGDEASRKEFVGQIRWRLTSDPAGISKGKFWEPESYFPPQLFDLLSEEVLLDGGAYIGDTVKDFLGRCPDFRGRVVAFEPDPGNRAKLQAFKNGLPRDAAGRIEIVPKGLWNREEVLRFNADGTMEALISDTGELEIPTVDIDTICQQMAIAPTLIKMDIQGAEPQAMEGARRMIERYKPLLAISIYHRFDDLWTIPNFSKALNPEYHFVLWPRMHEGWEMVMFGIPKDRLKSKAI